MSDRRAFRKTWLAHYSELLGAWRRRSHVDHDVEDAMHDAVLRILENGSVSADNPAAYLQRSTSNGLIDRHRREEKLPMVPLHELHESEHPLATGPESQVYSSQMVNDLRTVLYELPDICRQVYIYQRLEGSSHAEIASELGISRAMVEKHMNKALRHLSTRLQKYAP